MQINWMNLISNRTLNRGRDYCESGMVCSIEKRKNGWHAIVFGSEDYAVFVPSSLDLHFAECTCPHFAGGNICKHIAAVMFAIDSGDTASDGPNDGQTAKSESIEEIVERADASAIRAFLIEAALRDESIERQLRGTFCKADAKQAKRDLQKTTTALMRRYERGGFIDWRNAMDFECDYRESIDCIVSPLRIAEDVDGLIELAIARLVQLQRICIDDSDGFFTNAMVDVAEHIDLAYSWGDDAQRRKMLDELLGFLEENPGKDRGSIYWFEQDVIEDYIVRRFSSDPATAPSMLETARKQIEQLPALVVHGYDRNATKRTSWGIACMRAMTTTGSSPDEVRAYAEKGGLLETSDAIHALADAYSHANRLSEAAEIIRAHLNVRESFHYQSIGNRPARLVNRLIDITRNIGNERELAKLYASLLLTDFGYSIREDDLTTWYEELKGLVGSDAWDATRNQLLQSMPSSTVQLCLAHEGSIEELYAHIIADDGNGLLRFEKLLADEHPEPYIDYYLHSARLQMETAHERKGYRRVAKCLAHAAGLPGGYDRACEAALDFRDDYPRRSALLDELRSAGFVV
ncbi:MAG: SWIM zinc finger family protein [Eggerthellaceae bacterium]|nr:SWIM zinc finger family protein [Eggerthellaceae bacterium]